MGILEIKPLGFQWETPDPFLFCAFHADNYPVGNNQMGPDASLAGRNIGQDFQGKDGWRMYHGSQIPGFPFHPHRGFETITICEKGFVDHTDSMGAAGRFGNGDVQWMTAGKGLQHSEMFPLVHNDKPNPLVLFQIWLNLPRANKMVEPHFAMLWKENIPSVELQDGSGHKTVVDIIAGELNGTQVASSAPNSWAADPANEVAIWTIKMDANAQWTLPAARGDVNRTLYFYNGDRLSANGREIREAHSISVDPAQPITVVNGNKEARILMLQGKPLNEPVAQYGPFVMNSQEEIQQAFQEYQQTQFGGWPWPGKEYVHPREKGRFALYADGTEEVKS